MNLAGHSLKLIHSPNPQNNYRLCPKIEYPSNREIFLPKAENPDIAFLETLNRRKSERIFSSPLTLQQISSLFWHTLKIKRIETDKSNHIIWNHRNIPSAGGLATIDTFILNISGESKELFFYNPYKHSLNELQIEKKYIQALSNLSQNILDTTNATQLIFGAQIENILGLVNFKSPKGILKHDYTEQKQVLKRYAHFRA